jgi:hypothetical protein
VKKVAALWFLKSAWIIGHPVSFVSLVTFVVAWVATGRMPVFAGLFVVAVLSFVFGFRQSVMVMSNAFVKPPKAILNALLEWKASDPFAARFALVKSKR